MQKLERNSISTILVIGDFYVAHVVFEIVSVKVDISRFSSITLLLFEKISKVYKYVLENLVLNICYCYSTAQMLRVLFLTKV